MAIKLKADDKNQFQSIIKIEPILATKYEEENSINYLRTEANPNDLLHSIQNVQNESQIKQEISAYEAKSEVMEVEDTNIKQEFIENHALQKNQCGICHKIFRGKCLLEMHMRVHTGERPFNCTLCGKNFRQKSGLKTHLLSHTKIKPFKCTQCERAFVTKKDLQSHSLIHSCERPFVCEVCSRTFVSEKTLKYHKAQHTRGYPFGCDVCEMRFCYMHLLRRHMLTHTGEKPFKCKYCDKRFRQRHESVTHMQTHSEFNMDEDNPSLQQVLKLIHSLPKEGDICDAKESSLTTKPELKKSKSTESLVSDEEKSQLQLCTEIDMTADNEVNSDISKLKVKPEPVEVECDKKFVCKFCGARFALQNTLSHHVRQNMCSQKHFTCPNNKCQKVFASQEKLDAHILAHTYCDLCGESFSDSEKIESHRIEQHNLKVKHPCPHSGCNKAFYKGGQLEKHIKSHNIKKEFQCTLCDKSFNRKLYLTQHMYRHSKTRSFHCEQCSKAFYTSGELQRHIMRHTGDRPFPCDMCDKSYPLASELRVHKQTHSGERPFACEYCPMRFGLANVLKKHLITHTGERSFKCTICGRGFIYKQNCEDHMKTHSGEKEYGCETCGARYYTKDSLRKHMRTHKKIPYIEESLNDSLI